MWDHVLSFDDCTTWAVQKISINLPARWSHHPVLYAHHIATWCATVDAIYTRICGVQLGSGWDWNIWSAYWFCTQNAGPNTSLCNMNHILLKPYKCEKEFMHSWHERDQSESNRCVFTCACVCWYVKLSVCVCMIDGLYTTDAKPLLWKYKPHSGTNVKIMHDLTCCRFDCLLFPATCNHIVAAIYTEIQACITNISLNL